VEGETRKQPGVAKEYRNDSIVVTWEPAYCIHVANCLMGNPKVFDAMRRPWIDLSDSDADEVAEVVMSCPTGALHFRRLDGGEQEAASEQVNVVARPNGPLFLRGKVRIIGDDGAVLREDTRVALCRCGGSANKPFCDSTHRKIGFRTV
jgi:uncharacterized Fe-S cluster protein YjdI